MLFLSCAEIVLLSLFAHQRAAVIPARNVSPVYKKMTSDRACLLSSWLISSRVGTPFANSQTASDANNAAARPLPPSRSPNAFPWASSPHHSRVDFISPAQKSRIVVSPQYA
jgi:hypothetical protein